MEQVPSVGRIVHYVLPDGRHPGAHRPAIIVEVWGSAADALVNLQVFVDGTNDYEHYNGSVWVTSAHHSDSHEPRTWHWPERV